MEKAVKEENISALKEALAKATSLVLADFRGITVKSDTNLRREFRGSGCHYQVVKNTLLGIAVKGTPMDFTKPTAIGARINDNYEQLVVGKGYDHNWVINRTGEGLVLAAKVHEPTSGRILEVFTTQPGVQFYSGNFLDGTITGKHGHVYKQRYGLCLETQHFPDSPNHPDFPSTILKPGDKFQSQTVFKFSTEKM